MRILTTSRLLTLFLSVWVTTDIQAESVTYQDKLDIQVRFDERSNRPHRNQYRIRYYPQLLFGESSEWSINGLVMTGDEFASSHNTLGKNGQHNAYLRRLFLRHQRSDGKTEIGVIPTYKGRVSSSGLSKDGWIQGIRNVQTLSNDSAIEVVVGQLNTNDPRKAISAPDDIDYVELEYSARIDQTHSYELSLERMAQGNFARAEYRYKLPSKHTLFSEWVRRLDQPDNKLVAGVSGSFGSDDNEKGYFFHYSYVSRGFGPRAEYTEDYLGDGHGISFEIDGTLNPKLNLEWFVRVDWVEGTERILSGVKYSG